MLTTSPSIFAKTVRCINYNRTSGSLSSTETATVTCNLQTHLNSLSEVELPISRFKQAEFVARPLKRAVLLHKLSLFDKKKEKKNKKQN